MNQDLTIAGPGSPISLQKFRETLTEEKSFMVLIDGAGSGIAHDSADVLYITPEECSKQAIYYSKEVFNGVNIPAYLYRYMSYMFLDKELIESDQLLVKEFIEGRLTADSQDYKHILNLIKYTESNPESQQIIGLIQIISGALNMARKQNAGITIYLDRPETALHPKKQSRFMSMLMKLREEYGDIKT